MIPQKLIHTLTNATGFDEDYFVQSHNIQAPTSVRINLKKEISDFDNQQQIAWCKHAYNLDVRPSFTYSPLFHAGCYYVQEASSMFLHHVVKHISSSEPIPFDISQNSFEPNLKSGRVSALYQNI
jgi:16S rRNA C967 or C1407 C5-methylase (RsmB/RsmF family)